MNPPTLYEQLGGEEKLRRIVDRFYDLMSELPETKTIRALHPSDLTESRNKLFKFLSGFFGGPSLYIEEYGHPRLRARHLPFPIGEDERDQWLLCMNRALDELVDNPLLVSQLKMTFFRTADHMRNRAN
ncbi:Group 2 truncated hemoglobin YjbI [Stieleria maiorica]|uniref:Group 2 truncated hemoglobin YjbI n=1 Tax=Stieleria maiorica TaxID=2795974 RepID=A0A5B9MC45_9BACT|nr:group II truncated hemoglobin [Stieleria maiorica]QEF98782.1 Group 2 truncated hemoglobin YjbI [Stieleria maiorica]